MEAFGALLPYLSGSAIILLLSLLWITALLDIRSRMRKGTFSLPASVLMAVAISILTVCLIFATDAIFLDNTRGAMSPWTDWGFRLGS